MNELPLIALGGLLGSSHCVGMCGPFALTIGLSARGWSSALTRQVAYSLGRIFTYSCAGAVGGIRRVATCRSRLILRLNPSRTVRVGRSTPGRAGSACRQSSAPSAATFQSVAPGPRAQTGASAYHAGGSLPCGALRNFGGLLRSANLTHVFLGGLFTGFLPCGLVYAYLRLAASTADLFHGWLTMAAFGSGTVPAMVLAGAGGRLLSLAARRRLLQVAACCVIITGMLTIYRGAYAWPTSARGGTSDGPACPFCAAKIKPTSMSRTIVNLVLDILLALILLLVVTSACVVRFVFPPGTAAKGWKLWGLDYDAWANFEFVMLCIILLAVVVHVMLHWNWVCSVIATRVLQLRAQCASRRRDPDPIRRRHPDPVPERHRRRPGDRHPHHPRPVPVT